jgi:hypothetical protein
MWQYATPGRNATGGVHNGKGRGPCKEPKQKSRGPTGRVVGTSLAPPVRKKGVTGYR